MSGAIMEKVWGLLGVEPDRELDEENEELDYIKDEDIQEIDGECASPHVKERKKKRGDKEEKERKRGKIQPQHQIW